MIVSSTRKEVKRNGENPAFNSSETVGKPFTEVGVFEVKVESGGFNRSCGKRGRCNSPLRRYRAFPAPLILNQVPEWQVSWFPVTHRPNLP